METTVFKVNREILKDFQTTGRRILKQAEALDEFSRRLNNNLADERPRAFEDYETSQLLAGYRLVQTHNRIHNTEAGQLLAREVKVWLGATVPHLHGDWQEKPLLPCTAGQAAQFAEIHSWFNE